MDEKSLIQFAEVQMLQAEFAAGHDRDVLLHEAKDALLHAETLSKGSGAFLMACVHGRSGSESLCQRWLERARDAGRLPARDAIEKSAHLRPFRERDWFRAWMDTLEDL